MSRRELRRESRQDLDVGCREAMEKSAGRQEGYGGRRGDIGSRGVGWRKQREQREGSVHQLNYWSLAHRAGLDVLGDLDVSRKESHHAARQKAGSFFYQRRAER